MSDDAIQVTVVRAGGTATVKFADGYETMRVATGYLHDPGDGLIAEMREGRDAAPWASRAVRDEAAWSVEVRGDLDDATRRDLLDWIAGTAYFEGA